MQVELSYRWLISVFYPSLNLGTDANACIFISKLYILFAMDDLHKLAARRRLGNICNIYTLISSYFLRITLYFGRE